MEQVIQRGARAGWQAAESDKLMDAVQKAARDGLPLKLVFEQVGTDLGRKPNSIRNYYYQLMRDTPQQHLKRAAPFELFSKEDVHQLLRDVLIGKAQGDSVRACVMKRAGGDKGLMLRYQNKYRAIMKNKPHMLAEVAEELKQEGYALPEPLVFNARLAQNAPPESPMEQMAYEISDPAITAMMEGLNALLYRAMKNKSQDKLVELDRLRVAYDSSRYQWEKEEKRLKEALGDMMAICRDFLAQPMGLREQELPKFSADIAMALSNGEAILTEYCYPN